MCSVLCTMRFHALIRAKADPRRASVRRDLAKYARSVGASRQLLKAAMPGLATLSYPALVVWAAEDRVMPISTGRELAAAIPSARFVEIKDSYTLVPIDQPTRLSQEIRLFISSDRTAG